MDSYHTSSGKATTMRQSAGLSGEPIGEPRICWGKTAVPMENWVISKDMRMMDSMSRVKILRVMFKVWQALPLTTSPTWLPREGLTDNISSG